MKQWVPEHISRICPYVPGKPEEEIEGRGGGPSLKLASNENPLGPSPKAVAAAREALSQAHRYPDGAGCRLRMALSLRHDLPENQIILGNGSTDLVELLAKAFLGPDGWAVMATPSFIMYRIAVLAVNGHAREIPLRDMRHDLPAMAAACDERTVLVYIANPNNPTGTYVTREELQDYFQRIPPSVLTVLDEAYREYLEEPDYPSGREALGQGRRVVVLHTFSKAYGLAGLRIGYGLAPPDVVEGLERVRSPFNTSRIGQMAALAALEDQEHLVRSREVNRRGLRFLEAEFGRRGLTCVKSVANFILVDLGRDAGAIDRALLREGVITRPMAAYGMPACLRISVGTEPENRRLLEALDRARAAETPATS